ncbi:MAG: acyl-CoA dehydrogenase family protein [Bdellovibrionales bacterium]|nr:acyl-CoA dehydrogenase family protein [Bdellovibrionales bacterium]
MILDFVFESDSYENRELAVSVRKFAEANLGEVGFDRAHFSRMGELGLTGMSLDERYGGSAMESLSIASALFEISRIQLGPTIYLSVHLMVAKIIQQYGADENADLLHEMAAGRALGAFCLTEAQAGSDAYALRTRAEKSGNSWTINGEKIYITSAGLADAYVVFARTSDDKKNGITAFLLRKDHPGMSFGPHEKKMGAEGSPIATVTFENCKVDDSARLGEVGGGYKIALSGLNRGRVSIGAAACGLASRSIEIARAHLAERTQFGQALADFQGLRFMLADMATQLYASILLTRDAAQRLDSGGKQNWPSSMAKFFASDAAMKITTDGVQLLGGAGYLADYTAERLMRDAKMLQIVEGANQIQRLIVARALFDELA